MPHFLLLGFEVIKAFGMRRNDEWYAVEQFYAGIVEHLNFVGVVGQQSYGLDFHSVEHVYSDVVIAGVYLQTEMNIGVNRVEPEVLQIVSLEFIDDAYAPAFLSEVNDDTTVSGNHLHRAVQLLSAIAAPRTEEIAGNTLRMDAGEYGAAQVCFFMNKGEVRHPVGWLVGEGQHSEIAPFGGDKRFCL